MNDGVIDKDDVVIIYFLKFNLLYEVKAKYTEHWKIGFVKGVIRKINDVKFVFIKLITEVELRVNFRVYEEMLVEGKTYCEFINKVGDKFKAKRRYV